MNTYKAKKTKQINLTGDSDCLYEAELNMTVFSQQGAVVSSQEAFQCRSSLLINLTDLTNLPGQLWQQLFTIQK